MVKMAKPAQKDTFRNIFGNGSEGLTSVPGVDPINWKFNFETQNYDYIGPDDEDRE